MRISEGLLNINGFEWPEQVPLAEGLVKPSQEPGMFEVPDGGLSAIKEKFRSNRGLPGRLRSTNIHSEPDIVNRLIRMVEELLERDDLTPDADPTWYRNRLKEIKEEIAHAEDAGKRTGTKSGKDSEKESASAAD